MSDPIQCNLSFLLIQIEFNQRNRLLFFCSNIFILRHSNIFSQKYSTKEQQRVTLMKFYLDKKKWLIKLNRKDKKKKSRIIINNQLGKIQYTLISFWLFYEFVNKIRSCFPNTMIRVTWTWFKVCCSTIVWSTSTIIFNLFIVPTPTLTYQ